MNSSWQPSPREKLQRRPTHLSVASIGTSASGIADSTISFGSEWTGENGQGFRISQFPVPPSEIPTPTPSTYSGTPTSTSFSNSPATRFPPSPSDQRSLAQSGNSTPSTPRSLFYDRQDRAYPGPSQGADDQSMKSGSTVWNRLPPVPPLSVRKPALPSLPTQNARPPISVQPRSANAVGSAPSTQSPVSERSLQKRPASPTSLAGASTIDWSDAASGISVNPSEERLLSTSFITSLLAQTSDPLHVGMEKPPSAWRGYARPSEQSDTTSQSSRGGTSTIDSSTQLIHDPDKGTKRRPYHQSIPVSIRSNPSEHYLLGSVEQEPFPRRKLSPVYDNPASADNSRPASGDYSDTLHSAEDQVVTVVRSPSVTLGSSRAVGVVPAYRIAFTAKSTASDGKTMASNTSMITSTTLSPLPPVHRPDAPHNVGGYGGFDDGAPRESEEDYSKMGDITFNMSQVDLPTSPALPSTAGTTHTTFREDAMGGRSLRQTLQRNQSMKSVVSSIVSRVSRISNTSVARRAKYIAWLRKRPLPPLPPMPHNPPPRLSHAEEIQRSEDAIPLPSLMKRAEALHIMLDDGRLPAGSVRATEYYDGDTSEYKGFRPDGVVYANDRQSGFNAAGNIRNSQFSRFRRQKEGQNRRTTYLNAKASSSSPEQRKKRRRLWIIMVVVIFGILLIAIPVGLAEEKKGSSEVVCSGNLTGASCTLDATCVCTATSGSSCKPLAKSLFDLVDAVNTLFVANFSASSLSDALFDAQGQPTGNACGKQAVLVDVAPGLDSVAFPNRTKWAQSAILWNLGMSVNIGATTSLQKFVSSAAWSTLGSQDGSVSTGNQKFAVNASGFTFDFAAQTVSPIRTSFQQDANPGSAQLSEVSVTAGTALDRMYSFALGKITSFLCLARPHPRSSTASSTQRQATLRQFWTSTLQRQDSDLSKFISAVQNSAFILPFDATSSPGGTALTTLMANTTTTPFPPPLACYPGLSSTQLEKTNSLETIVFGLSSASSASSFDTSCFPDRPIYGVVNLLHLHLPFPDGREGVGLQGAVLSQDAKVRAVVYSGEMVSALPGATTVPDTIASSLDPREFGTASHLNHVLLNYLSSISNSNSTLASKLIDFVLSSSSAPPSDPDLLSSLSSLPILEFALFGSITPRDISSSVTSFSTPSGSLFFGSDKGQTFRSWALTVPSQTVAWATGAFASQIVRERSTPNSDFESVWTPASQLIHTGSEDSSSVQKITDSLSSFGLFSSS